MGSVIKFEITWACAERERERGAGDGKARTCISDSSGSDSNSSGSDSSDSGSGPSNHSSMTLSMAIGMCGAGAAFKLSFLAAVVASTAAAPPKFAFSNTFSDDMVLQAPFVVWGYSDAGCNGAVFLSTSAGGDKTTAKVGCDGVWRAQLPGWCSSVV